MVLKRENASKTAGSCGAPRTKHANRMEPAAATCAERGSSNAGGTTVHRPFNSDPQLRTRPVRARALITRMNAAVAALARGIFRSLASFHPVVQLHGIPESSEAT